jgi:hypothetical protein
VKIYINKTVVYCNIGALAINGVIVWLMAVKYFPPTLGVTLFIGFFAGAVWFSCKVNGKPPKSGREETFYSARTEKVERL